MKEHPILFSTEMVQAIISGQKTMTRRIIKPQETFPHIAFDFFSLCDEQLLETMEIQYGVKCIYGKPGDLLWVRETFEEGCMGGYIYKADRNDLEIKQYKECGYKWKSSRFMPKEASRIWLKITNRKIERLKEITERDAKAEGVYEIEENEAYKDYMQENNGSFAFARGSFFSLWAFINGAASLYANPWVWVIEFEVISTDGRPRICRVCGCTDINCEVCIQKIGEPCYWVEDNLCSACMEES